MCNGDSPVPAAEKPSRTTQTFTTTSEILAAIGPGMDLCSSDFNRWGIAESGDKRHVRVPADRLIDIRGGHCVRIDRVRATLNHQGWEN